MRSLYGHKRRCYICLDFSFFFGYKPEKLEAKHKEGIVGDFFLSLTVSGEEKFIHHQSIQNS